MKITISQRFKELDLKISELASYMNISRPTLYKYIHDYDLKNYQNLNFSVKKVFDYAIENPLINKNNIIRYIINNFMPTETFIQSDSKSSKLTEIVLNDLNLHEYDSEKSITFLKSDVFIFFTNYFCDIKKIENKKRKNEDDIFMLNKYNEILSYIKKFKE